MQISWILWWLVSTLEVGSFIVISIFLWLRNIDGSGALQTTDLKLLNIFILGLFYLIPFIIQIIWLVTNLIIGNKNNSLSINH